MNNQLVAQRYAKAILMNIEKNEYGFYRTDIKALNRTFAEDWEYVSSLNSFLYPLKERLYLSEKISEKLINSIIWKNLFYLLIKKHRFSIIGDVLNELENYILIANKKVKATLTIAYEHDDKTIKKIVNEVEKKLNSKIEVTVKIDPSIIGGFVAETDTMRIDGSIYNNLVKLVQLSSKQILMR